MATYEITTELVLKPVIAEAREVAQALNEFADALERIDTKYSGKVDDKADRETQKAADEWEEWNRAKEKFFKETGGGE